MFACYNLALKASPALESYDSTSQRHATRIRMRSAIDDFMASGTVDAAALENEWFGQGKFDIFISHSHADFDLANKLALLLESRLKLKSFVDSTVWGYADELLREIDNEFCLSLDKKTYAYEKRNRSTSHVHMMLAAALSKVIDQCECVLFLNTENSIRVAETIKRGDTHTASPWIYHELLTTKVIRRYRRQENLREAVTMDSVASLEKRMPDFIYEAPTAHLTTLSQIQLERWLEQGTQGTKALDRLYKQVPPK